MVTVVEKRRSDRHDAQRGGASVEWVGVVLAACVLASAVILAAGPLGTALGQTLTCTVAKVVDRAGSKCGQAATVDSGQPLTSLVRQPIPTVSSTAQDQGSQAAVSGSTSLTAKLGSDPAVEAVVSPLRDAPPGTDPGVTSAQDLLRDPSYWDASSCNPRQPKPGCPKPPPAPVIKAPDGTVAERNAAAETLAALADAQDYYYRRFGWAGYDGKASPLRVELHDPDSYASADIYDPVATVTVSDKAAANSFDLPSSMLHEYGHFVFNHFIPYTQVPYGSSDSPAAAQDDSVNEGMSMMAEVETRGRDWVDNITDGATPAPYTWTCPAAGDPYTNASLIVAAFTDIARNTGTVTLGGTSPDPLTGELPYDSAWERISSLRFDVVSETLPQYAKDGHVGFGEVRAAFIESARNVDLDPYIVAQAFSRQGITSTAWQPPATPGCYTAPGTKNPPDSESSRAITP